MKRILTEYTHHTGKLSAPVKLAVISDLHNEPYDDLLDMIRGADALLVPGDISNRYTQEYDVGAAFLRDAARTLPTFFSLGNHEVLQPRFPQMMRCFERSGAAILVNHYARFGELWIGGWFNPIDVKRPCMLNRFEKLEGPKVIMCHRPEHFVRLMSDRDIDLAVAGHAHGGQIRLGRQGVYSPGQGLFPRYTRGVVNGRLIISAGVGNPAHMPRWGNPREVLMITMD